MELSQITQKTQGFQCLQVSPLFAATPGISSAKTTASPLKTKSDIVKSTKMLYRRDTPFQMPVDVTVQVPWTSVISRETESDVVTSCTNADSVAARRVNVVVRRAACSADDVEGMTVQVEGMITSSRDRNLDSRVRWERVYGAGREQSCWVGGTAEDLKKYWDARRVKGYAIHSELTV